jgi:hypothetical protein
LKQIQAAVFSNDEALLIKQEAMKPGKALMAFMAFEFICLRLLWVPKFLLRP